ncbi:MAG: 2-oxo acid dehydrogenase subunit E2, partial [Micrococcales bacterium]|nr:2-oxo acid dehydrogenase subunit E2 [Micrococcales bacterium]
ILAEIETDKSTMDLEAYDAGTLTKILVDEGTTVPIGQPLAVIGEPDSSAEPAPDSAQDSTQEPTEESAPQRAPEPAPSPESESPAPAPSPETAEPAVRVRATPLVRSLARERDIDLATVQGSGPGGRIIRADLDDLAATGPAPEDAEAAPVAEETAARAPAAAPAPSAASVQAGEDDEQIPLSSIRRITAERLTQSAAAPHFYLTMTVDTAPLLGFRAEVNAQLAADGVKVTVTDLLIRACAVALRAHPEVNSSWGGDHIVRRGHVNVGIAVAIDEGLIVPVIRDADRKTIREIGAEARELGERARAGRLSPDEFSGGTFTISNLGMFGISEFTAVINPPEAAILAVGAAAETPVIKDGEVSVTSTMRVTLTVDHRVLDGATAANFLRDLVRVLEEPLRIVT